MKLFHFVLRKGVNSSVLQLLQSGRIALFKQLVEEKENSEFKPAIFSLKIDLESHPACRGEVG